jgi:hypothetical protein
MKSRRRLLAFAACLVFLAIVLFVARKSVIRLFVAAVWNECRFYWDFAEIREAREKRLKRFEPELKPLV